MGTLYTGNQVANRWRREYYVGMDENKKRIVAWVRQIDDLKTQVADHWLMVQKAIAAERVDEAISLLNAYFRLRTKLEGVEASLVGTLGGYFSDK
jgi:hypothetical protein